jgi:hypothetical protein
VQDIDMCGEWARELERVRQQVRIEAKAGFWNENMLDHRALPGTAEMGTAACAGVSKSNLNHVKLFVSFLPGAFGGTFGGWLAEVRQSFTLHRPMPETYAGKTPAKLDNSFPFWLTRPISCR